MSSTAATAQELVTRRAEYVELIARLRQSVPRLIPPGSQLLVVSRGDDALLEIPSIVARHFPQDAEGRYAGHYPHDSEAAIEHLESHQQGGAAFLLFPATSLWWLDHYDGLREHLDARYRRVRSDDDCIIYDIRRLELAAADPDAALDPEAARLWVQIRDLLDALLGPDDHIMVLVREASDTIIPGRRPAERALLRTVLTDESHAGPRPTSDARFLVIPHPSSADPEDASRAAVVLADRYRLVARHQAVCTVMELRPPAEAQLVRHLRSVHEGRGPSSRKAGG